jgi:hypothetical protein
MNPQDRRMALKGLDVDQMFSGTCFDRLTSGCKDEWMSLSTVLKRLKTQCSAWLYF